MKTQDILLTKGYTLSRMDNQLKILHLIHQFGYAIGRIIQLQRFKQRAKRFLPKMFLFGKKNRYSDTVWFMRKQDAYRKDFYDWVNTTPDWVLHNLSEEFYCGFKQKAERHVLSDSDEQAER